MKRARQNIILEIIAAKDIETQNQLMQALSELGVKSTQATLSRDIALLMKGGFGLVRLTPFDMFPETMNLETLAVLERVRAVDGAEGDEK